MDDNVPHTSNNERWIIDRLVDAVEAGDADVKAKLGQRLLDGIDNDNWNAGKLIEAGQFLPLAFLDPDNIEDDDLEWFCEDETIPDARLNEVLNGGLSGLELTRGRQRAFAPGEFDRDMLWVLIMVRRTGGGLAYVASFGYDLTALTFVAAYDTYTETINGLRAQGFTGWKDYQARSAEVLAENIV